MKKNRKDNALDSLKMLEVTSVRKMIEDELRYRDQEEDLEPEISFTVKVPMTEVGMLESVASYLGQKRSPFASALLARAAQEAFYSLLDAEDKNGRGKEVREHLGKRVQIEEVGGWTQHNVGLSEDS